MLGKNIRIQPLPEISLITSSAFSHTAAVQIVLILLLYVDPRHLNSIPLTNSPLPICNIFKSCIPGCSVSKRRLKRFKEGSEYLSKLNVGNQDFIIFLPNLLSCKSDETMHP